MSITKQRNTSKKGERPTLKTIARLSGLAVPTVSRALNDAPDIGNATKDKIRRIAREIGYQPNRAGLRLRTGKTNVIALVLSTEHDVMHHTSRLITSIAGATRDTAYHMIVTPYFPDQDPMDPVRYITETGSADGIILNQTEPDDPRVAHLLKLRFPFATHGRTNWSDRHPYFDFNNGTFGALCVDKLVERGRRNIVMVAPRRGQFYSIEMIEAATAAAKRAKVKFRVLSDVTSDDAPQTIEGGVRAELEADATIDGTIAGSSNAAIAIIAAFEALGLEVGDQFDTISKEALPFLKRFRKEILTVPEDVTTAGDFLGRAVMQAIDDPDAALMQRLDEPDRVL